MRKNAPAEHIQDIINFIGHHRLVLIRSINYVDLVLRDLRDLDLLTEEQINDVMEKTTLRGKMRKLCGIIKHWEDIEKYTAYTVLRKYNGKIIRDLEIDWRRNYSSGMSRDKVNFIEHQRSNLIRRITEVDPILQDLRGRDLLTEEQINDVTGKMTSEEKMEELCDIISHWEDTGKFTAYTVLRKYHKDIIEDLHMQNWYTGSSTRGVSSDQVNFINHHRSALIGRITDIFPVLAELRFQEILSEEHYIDVNEKTTSHEKMEALCDIISHWEDNYKGMAYTFLIKYNEEIMEDIEAKAWARRNAPTLLFRDKVTFIDHHQLSLIRRITDVDSVVRDLRDLLIEEQYNDLIEKTTSEEKMRELCDIIRHWEDIEKYTAYTVLRKYHEEVIRDLEIKDWKRRNDPLGLLKVLGKHNEKIIEDLEIEDWMRRMISSGGFSDKVTCVDNHRSDLISWIIDVDPVLCDLWERELLTEEQYNNVMEKTTSREKMEDLCDIISHWEDTGKYTAYTVLRKYNEKIIKDLENFSLPYQTFPTEDFPEKLNFTEYYQSALIRRITAVDPILRHLEAQYLLTEEEINDVMEKTTSEEKMRELCGIISHWEDTGKYMAYAVLRDHNEEIIRDLEMKDWMMRNDPSGSSRDMANFIEFYQSTLIRRITDVDQVLRDLRGHALLSEEQYNDVMEKMTSEEKMEELCGIISHWEDPEKYTAYTVLRRYNKEFIIGLELVDRMRRNGPTRGFLVVRKKLMMPYIVAATSPQWPLKYLEIQIY
ncbi:uncharacterized protein LOC142302828 [Anomaloglossus baeobatrachus]|uniref:uncharacterized protein LOC142302828 n=1 Tax=Anomaloglossus baeobatrachus TaxID=238106 RepID=UPI003F4FE151